MPASASLQHRRGASRPIDPVEGAERLRAFLSTHDAVKIWEQGRIIARLRTERSGFALSTEGGALVCHFWSPEANLVRRVHAIQPAEPDAPILRLDCVRMGHPQPLRLVLDAAPEGLAAPRIAREEFREAVAAACGRDWTDWHIDWLAGIGTGAVQRLLFRHGQSIMACAAVSDQEPAAAAESALAAGLVWAEKLRARFPSGRLVEVRLVVPESAWRVLQPRLAFLDTGARLTAFAFDRSAGRLRPWEAEDAGNLSSRLRRAVDSQATFSAAALDLLTEARAQCPHAEIGLNSDGRCTLQLWGLEFAREARPGEAVGAAFTFGCGAERTPLMAATHGLFETLLADLRHRNADGNRHHPLHALQPERWMESLLRGRMAQIEPRVDPRFVYSQVPVCRPGHRDIVDLLAVDRDGRLLVVELKASHDLGFPLQALDYWLRVRHHQLLGDFERLGYFPGIRLSPLPPRLLMVAPALQWHPHTPELLRWFAATVPWERVGLNENWRREIRVVARWQPGSA